MQATAKDLRFHTKALMESISRGEEVIITYHGKPYAKLIPFSAEMQGPDRPTNPLRGIWKDHPESEDVAVYVNSMRKGRQHDG